MISLSQFIILDFKLLFDFNPWVSACKAGFSHTASVLLDYAVTNPILYHCTDIFLKIVSDSTVISTPSLTIEAKGILDVNDIQASYMTERTY